MKLGAIPLIVVAVAWTLGSAEVLESPPGAVIAESLAELKALPAVEPFIYGDVPAEATPLLQTTKREFQRLVASVLDRQGAEPLSSVAIRRAIVDQLGTHGVSVGESPSSLQELAYGYIRDIDVTLPVGHTQLVAVTATLSITCGTDTLLLLSWRDGDNWKPLLVENSAEYGEISGAYGAFSFRVSAPAPDGTFVVVTANIPPWCTSVWHPLRYVAYRIAPSDGRVTRLVSDSTELIAMDKGYEIDVAPERFSLEYSASDEGMRVRKVVTYEITGGDARQIAPDTVDWQTYRNAKYGYEIRYPIDFETWPTGPPGERDGRTIRIARREYSAPVPVLDIRAQAKMPDLETLGDLEIPNMELSVDNVTINGLPALELTYRWKTNGDIAFVHFHVGDVLIEFDAGAGLRDVRETPWWRIISTFRLQGE
ncbi:MAG: hypothetical protein GY722_06210 [bacterium]|nr:hypothetical protein [bacterium]